MKREKLDALVAGLVPEIHKTCESAGVPLGTVYCDGAIKKSELRSGKIGRLYLILDDSDPGWRAKDKNPKRSEVKRRVREILAANGLNLSVRIQANYSCLSIADGIVLRRNNSGRVIGAYEA